MCGYKQKFQTVFQTFKAVELVRPKSSFYQTVKGTQVVSGLQMGQAENFITVNIWNHERMELENRMAG